MRLIVVAAVPIALMGAWWAWRLLRGRPVRRFAMNAVVGVMLLGYFAITAGLGIFWVANQELPVFDPHYLFGYLTLLLVAIHVAINVPLLARFVHRHGGVLTEGRGFRPSVRWAARVVAIGLFGGLCYWLGWSRGSTHVTVERGDPVHAPGAARAEVGMPEQIVTEDGARIPLARWYHGRSSLSRSGVVARGPALDVAERPAAFEHYASEAIVALPREAVLRPTGVALDAARDEVAALGDAEVSLDQLGQLLHLTQGITEVSGLDADPFYKRAAASSGALYPTVTHVVVGDVRGLEPGLYHYEPRGHALHRLRGGDVRAELAATVGHPEAVGDAPFALVLSAIYLKSSWKYEERAYRYVLLDAGHVAANAMVAGAALDLASRPLGRFDDARLAALLGVSPHRQGPLLVVSFGAPRDAGDAAIAFTPVDLELEDGTVPASVLLMAGRTALAATGGHAAFQPAPPLAALASGDRVTLPTASGDDDALGAVIERRRSERRFDDASITAAELAAIVRRAGGASVEAQRAQRLHVIALRVDGVAPGAYEVDPQTGALIAVRPGDLAADIHAAALSQEVTERAAAILVLSVDVATMIWPDGSRGYRYGWLDAGITAGRIYLQAVALDLGVSSIGAFFDDDLTALLRLDASVLPALLVAIGRP